LADGRPAAVSIGSRPTFVGATPGTVVEVHIPDFDGDLYGHDLDIRLIERLREERRFDGVAELVAQLERDVERVRAITARRAGGSAPDKS
jgi:riboflavin kinase/FMN adenylyltransferase